MTTSSGHGKDTFFPLQSVLEYFANIWIFSSPMTIDIMVLSVIDDPYLNQVQMLNLQFIILYTLYLAHLSHKKYCSFLPFYFMCIHAHIWTHAWLYLFYNIYFTIPYVLINCRHYHFGILKHIYAVGMFSNWVIFPLNRIPLFFKLPRFLVEYHVLGTTCTEVTTDLKSTS